MNKQGTLLNILYLVETSFGIAVAGTIQGINIVPTFGAPAEPKL